MAEVRLAPHSGAWSRHFEEVRRALLTIFGDPAPCVEHVGSTAVPGLVAKPVIDVLLQAPTLADIDARAEALAHAGFGRVRRHDELLPQRRYFVRTAGAAPRVNLHAVGAGSGFGLRIIAFRDALRQDPALAQRYAVLKAQLAKAHGDDSGRYNAGKSSFISGVLDRPAGL